MKNRFQKLLYSVNQYFLPNELGHICLITILVDNYMIYMYVSNINGQNHGLPHHKALFCEAYVVVRWLGHSEDGCVWNPPQTSEQHL